MVAPGVGERTARAGKQNTGRSVDRFTIADKTNYPAVDTRILRAALHANPSGVSWEFRGSVFECSNPARTVGCCIYFVANVFTLHSAIPSIFRRNDSCQLACATDFRWPLFGAHSRLSADIRR
mgnify:FL=1